MCWAVMMKTAQLHRQKNNAAWLPVFDKSGRSIASDVAGRISTTVPSMSFTLPQMKHILKFGVITRVLLMLLPVVVFGQNNENAATELSGTSPALDEDKVVVLNPFIVTSEPTTRYQAAEATSATRISVNLFESSSTINVLTSAFLKDIGPIRAIDSLKYVSGIAESTQPVGGDRIQVRGFQTDGQVLDGFARIGPYNHLETYLLDSVEVVKGPNAILNPSGQPGGTVNYVSKKANFGNAGEIMVQSGQHDANKVAFDVNRVIDKNVAVRVVGAAVNDKGYFGNMNKSYNLMPSVSFRWGTANSLILQGVFQRTKRTFVGGVPISPLASTTNKIIALWPNVPGDARLYDEKNNPRDETGNHIQAFYTGKITDNLSVRLAGHILFGGHDAIQFTQTPVSVGGLAVTGNANINPFTGFYDPTTIWGGAPTFVAQPAPTPTNMFNRSSFSEFTDELQYDLQNDYSYALTKDTFKATTTAGYSITRNLVNYRTDNYSLPAFNITGPYVYVPATNVGTTNLGKRKTSITQFYLNESVDFMKDRITFTAGLSNNIYRSRVDSISKNGTNAVTTTKLFPSYGLVIKPAKNLSFYAGSSQSAALNPPDVGVRTKPLQEGEQYEVGARYRFFHDKAVVTANYFDITQSNFQVPNPGNLNFPAPVPPLAPLASDRTATGWEYSLSLELSKEFSLIANYTNFKNRDINGAKIRGTAEESGAAWMQYNAGRSTKLSGLSVGVGVSYSGERPGDVQSGLAQGSVLAGTPVIRQPTFFLPAYKRVDVALGYRINRQWAINAFVENLLDTKYLAGSLNRNQVVVGLPLNVRADVTYSF
jgi:iron complex outermembrane recepter protein